MISSPETDAARVCPIRLLREHANSLEAAITLARAKPAGEAVHRMRTSARRIEADIILLALLRETDAALPEHAREARRARRQLRRLRRTAGAVRDLDVECKLLAGLLREGEAEGSSAPAGKLHRQAGKLRRRLKRRRGAKAADLLGLLRRASGKTVSKLERLLEVLEPAADLALAQAQALLLADEWYGTRSRDAATTTTADQLHDIRKAAKLAQYMVEGAAEPAGDAPDMAAQRFHELQRVGGEWHDLLTLAAFAGKRLGKHAELANMVRARRADALEAFRQILVQPARERAGFEGSRA